jgi:hypothetical protein
MLIQETTEVTTAPTPGGWTATYGTLTLVFLVVVVVLLLIVVLVRAIWKGQAVRPGQSLLDYGALLIVALGITAALIAYLVTMLFAANLFEDPNQVLALLTALFGIIAALVAAFFGVKTGLDALAARYTDTTAPTITITVPENNAPYGADTNVLANYSCQDEPGGSGVKSCIGTVNGVSIPNGAAIPTAAPGPYTFTVTAEDNAGNKNTLTHTYTIG